ncbi:MAG: HAMP domain-containing histidine kinase [Acidobacteria bacterium]|nr:MAG: HAMP domain-containing histidine kinase [Acidobacteriota bacterium]
MDRRRLFVALLWPSALVVLVAVLAFFQYRWLGQVSEADRERQRTTLNQRAREFAADFDREIGRIYAALQYDEAGGADATAAFVKHYNEWKESSAFPQLVRAIYLTGEPAATSGADNAVAPIPLNRFDPSSGGFSATDWPAALAPVRDRMMAARQKFTAPATPFSSGGNATFRFVSIGQSPVFASVPALLIPTHRVQHITTGPPTAKDVIRFEVEPLYVIVELDKQVLTDTVLPALVEKHLAVDDYRVEVLESAGSTPPAALYRKGLAASANLSPATADAATSFFSVRVDNMRDTILRALPADGLPPVPDAASSGSRMSIVVSESTAKAGGELKSVAAARQGVEAALQNRSTIVGRAGGFGASVTYGPGAWQLVLQHPAGSLDAAVAQARRRNLAISFGVLAVLSVSVFMISINAQRSQQLAAQQMDFVATVSHELRTPIAVIRSAAQNLSAGVIHDEARAKKYGELIDTEGRRLTDMVEEVLEFAGISGGKRQFAIAPTDIGRLTSDVVQSCESLIREAGFTLDVAIAPNLPPVNLDESAYRRALNNLIGNALKYAAGGRWLGIVINATPDNNVQVTVSDKGGGIDAKDLPHIFEAFYRGRYAKERQIHGNGLGLSLVKRIVEAHGGSVAVHSTPAGSAFTMTFPVQA